MRFTELELGGTFAIDPEPVPDARGSFARTFDRAVLEARGLEGGLAECSLSQNAKKGTLRGMHYQAAPHEETKLVSCVRGAIFDVLVDLRPASPTFRRWVGVPVDAKDFRMIYVPKGIAHGFQTLEDDVVVQYWISAPYRPEAARGVRWNDPAFGIRWPLAPTVMSPRDEGHPDFSGGP